jgi:XTP/dITP diphosphohydrolase
MAFGLGYSIGMADRILYIATGNSGKLRDFAAAAESALLKNRGYSLAPIPCLELIPPPAEDEVTFEGNARAKAIYYSRLAPGLDILADDSGLEVDALDGGPGVRSARFAGDAGFTATGNADADNNLLLLESLRGVPPEGRTARYRCVLALANTGECVLTTVGSVEGSIAEMPQGDGGFGYDPLFFLPELGKTMAEIDLETKNSLSHRGRALRALFEYL